jgi:hypothetical protein
MALAVRVGEWGDTATKLFQVRSAGQILAWVSVGFCKKAVFSRRLFLLKIGDG